MLPIPSPTHQTTRRRKHGEPAWSAWDVSGEVARPSGEPSRRETHHQPKQNGPQHAFVPTWNRARNVLVSSGDLDARPRGPGDSRLRIHPKLGTDPRPLDPSSDLDHEAPNRPDSYLGGIDPPVGAPGRSSTRRRAGVIQRSYQNRTSGQLAGDETTGFLVGHATRPTWTPRPWAGRRGKSPLGLRLD